MLNKLLYFLRKYEMVQPGDRVVCAVSGGADSLALLFAMYLLSEKLQITVEAAHFNHHLRGDESQRDEAFVRCFCDRYGIPLHCGEGKIVPGEKGLEAAARDARYSFLRTLSGKIATAHTADDNAETVLMHLIRGTGLKGLGGITPVRGNLIRPMLSVTRNDVILFLEEYHLSWVEDSSNKTDDYLRNRVRHQIMPLLRRENPSIAQKLSGTALRLRTEEEALASQIPDKLPNVQALRGMHPGIRGRALSNFLCKSGILEPESSHIEALEKLVFSAKPSAQVNLPGGVTVTRNYDQLVVAEKNVTLAHRTIVCPSVIELPEVNIRIRLRQAAQQVLSTERFTVKAGEELCIRNRRSGDLITLSGGTKELKKLFIDRKIPARMRDSIPVIADECGILGVYGVGANLSRISGEPPFVEIIFEEIK